MKSLNSNQQTRSHRSAANTVPALLTLAITFLLVSSSAYANNEENQARMDVFYSAANVVSVTIEMNSDEWNQLKNQQPAPANDGRCNNDYTGSRYSWFRADSVRIDSADSESAQYTYLDVGVKKKSYCGSFSDTKPSLNINLAKYDDSNEDKAEGEIGSKYLTLNNSLQDPKIMKQCFGYQLFRMAGLATSRCNFTSLTVYSPDTDSSEYMGIYVNLEPVKKKYLKHKANGFEASDEGNLYEMSTHDFDLSGVVYDEYKGYSDEFIRQDFAYAAMKMQANAANGIERTIDVAQFTQYWAMEAIIQHRDGYSRNLNNTYIYNDKNLADATALDGSVVNFKFLPWGIDQTMESNTCWQLYHCAIVANGLFNQSTSKGNTINAVNQLLALFSSNQAELDSYIDTMASSANSAWTGTDPLFGPNDGTINNAANYLKAWLDAAINNASRSIDGGRNQSCRSDCPYN